MLGVKLLGQFEVRVDGLPAEIPLRAAQSLLAYLILNAGTPFRRELLAGLFWPSMTDMHARHNLRQALSRLRKTMGEQYFITDDLTIAFNATSDYWLDAQVLAGIVEAQTSTNDLINAVSIYGGELLPGFYDEWVLLERERLHVAFEHKMTLLLERLSEAHRWEEAIEWSERWIALGHTPEAAYRTLISAYGARSDVSNATIAYQRCAEALRRDLGVEPSPQTRAALERAKRDSVRAFDLLPKRPRTNLPASLSSFIGREKESAEVQRLIIAHRAVTLTGSGGAGKTRLALESTRDLVDHFAAGVWLIEFASLNDGALVPHVVASTLGVLSMGGRPVLTALIDVLREKHRLLIFDNCEHLIEACAQLAERLLRACSELHILSTSREALGIAGEVALRVPPLSSPDAHQPATAPEAVQYEAVQLFVARGAAVLPDYALTADNAAPIVRICQRLDGMPLAIELAAARLKVLRVEEIAARLDDRLRLLTTGSRTALPRQQTLRATIDWSYGLLPVSEQTLLQWLSVFAGNWTLDAAEKVCHDAGSDSVLDLLAQLVNKSLVNVDHTQEQGTCYRMLDTIRAYAREKLIEFGEEVVLRQRHLDYYVQLAERAEPELVSFDQFAWLDRLEAEYDNIRTALDWSLIADAESGLRLASALRWFWVYSAQVHVAESSEYLSRLLELSTPQTIARTTRAKALVVFSELIVERNELARALQLTEESLALYRAAGDEQGETLALLVLARVFGLQGRANEDLALHEQCLALSRAHNDQIRAGEALLSFATGHTHWLRRSKPLEDAQVIFRAHGHWIGLAFTLNQLAQLAIFRGDNTLARRQLDESMSITRRAPTVVRFLAYQMLLSGRLALREGDYARARVELEESAQLFLEAGRNRNHFWALTDLGYVLLHQGDLQRAYAIWAQSLLRFREANTPIGIVFNIEGLANLAMQQGDFVRAGRLIAWTDAAREAISDLRPPVEQADIDRDLAVIHAQLDEATFVAEQAIGRAMTMDEAIAYALSKDVVD